MTEFAKQAVVFDSEKKHSVRYNAADPKSENAAVTAIYIMKKALPVPYPKAVVVTFETLPTKGE